jgi:hypothetical protein
MARGHRYLKQQSLVVAKDHQRSFETLALSSLLSRQRGLHRLAASMNSSMAVYA